MKKNLKSSVACFRLFEAEAKAKASFGSRPLDENFIAEKSNSLEFLAPPFVSRQKVANKNDSDVRLRKTGSDFMLLEFQASVKKIIHHLLIYNLFTAS